jgi:hypothetical protein
MLALGLAPFVWLAVWFSTHIQDLGSLISYVQDYEPDLGFDYAMGVLWWVVFAILILIVGGESRQMLLIAWLGRFVVTLMLMPFYESYYPLDSSTYYRVRLTGQFSSFEGTNFLDDLWPSLASSEGETLGSTFAFENTLRLILWVGLVTGPYFHAMKVGCAFLGLLGVWYFYRAATVALARPRPALFYLLAFSPSIIFWGSILGKDPLLFFFLGIYAYGSVQWLVQNRVGRLWMVALGLLGPFLMRPLLAMLGAAALVLAVLLGRGQRVQLTVVMMGCFIAMLFMDPSKFRPELVFGEGRALEERGLLVRAAGISALTEIARMKVEGIVQDTSASGGSGADLSSLTSPDAMMGNLPLIMFSGLFRPLPFDVTNLFTAMSAVENALVLLLAVAALFGVRLSNLRDPLVMWSVAYCLLWTTTHGLIVMANFGTGVRYRLQALPFLLLLSLLLAHREGRRLLESRMPTGLLPVSKTPS